MSLGKSLGSLIVEVIEAEKKRDKHCSECKKQHSMDCPNSKECYFTWDRPYFEKLEE